MVENCLRCSGTNIVKALYAARAGNAGGRIEVCVGDGKDLLGCWVPKMHECDLFVCTDCGHAKFALDSSQLSALAEHTQQQKAKAKRRR